MARKLAKKSVGLKVEGMRPWDDPEAIIPDQRPWYAQLEPAEGVPVWESLYHFIDADRSERFYLLDLMGYGDEANRNRDWPDEELADFNSKHFHWNIEKDEFEHLLYLQLRNGQLIARGFSSTSALDAPRQVVAPERWVDLELDIKNSRASGPGVEITQLLVFDSFQSVAKPAKSMVRTPCSKLRDWYSKWIVKCQLNGKIPTRDEDYRAAQEVFKDRVVRRPVWALRRELAPHSWTQKGRRRKPTAQFK